MNNLFLKIFLSYFVYFFIYSQVYANGIFANSEQSFNLEYLLTENIENFKKSQWPRNFHQGLYSRELICYRKGYAKFNNRNVKEVILTFSENGDFERADIVLDYLREDGKSSDILKVQAATSSMLTSIFKSYPKKFKKEFYKNRIIYYEYWEGEYCRTYLYYRRGNSKNNISFVSLRVESLKIPQRNPVQWYTAKNRKLKFAINKPDHKLLKAPMRYQLPGLQGCWFTANSRIATSVGSEIPSLVLATLIGGIGLRDGYHKAWKQIGIQRKILRLNDRKTIVENAANFTEYYNKIAKKMNRRAIKLIYRPDGQVSYANLKTELDNDVLKYVKINCFDEKYRDFRKYIKNAIDKGHPLQWDHRVFLTGGHAVLIVGYDICKDVIYYSDHWGGEV